MPPVVAGKRARWPGLAAWYASSMSAAEDLYRQALALPEAERLALVERIAATLAGGDDDDLDPEDVALALHEMEEHRRDPSTSLSADEARAWLAERRASR